MTPNGHPPDAASAPDDVTAARDAVLEEIDGYIDAAGTGLSRTDQIVKEKAKWKAEARELVERYEQAVRRAAARAGGHREPPTVDDASRT